MQLKSPVAVVDKSAKSKSICVVFIVFPARSKSIRAISVKSVEFIFYLLKKQFFSQNDKFFQNLVRLHEVSYVYVLYATLTKK